MQVKLNTLESAKKNNFVALRMQNNALPAVVVENNDYSRKFMPAEYYAPIKTDKVSPAFKSRVISFTGAAGIPKVFLGAEYPDYDKVGGVATVMKDYNDFGEPMVIPYYNGKVEYDPQTGKPTGKVSVLTDKAGNPIYTKLNQDEFTLDEILTPDDKGRKKYVELEKVRDMTMEWGDNPKSEIALYKVKGKNHYMVYTDQSAKMPRPYATEAGEYHSGVKAAALRKAKVEADAATDLTKCGWQGTYTGQFGKAFSELWDVPGYEKAVYICSDSQMAFVPHYMQQKALAGDARWKDAKASAVLHNIGSGYTAVGKAKDMFVNLGATPSDIERLQNNPDYIKSFTVGGEENFFKTLLPECLDASGDACDLMIPLKLRKDGYLTGLATVSELYAESVATNPEVSPGLYPFLKDLYNDGKFTGIMNPLQDPSLAYDKPIGLKYYGNDVTVTLKDGTQKTFPKFEVFTEKMTYDEVKEVKRKNRLSLLSRLTGELQDSDMNKIAGLPDRKAKLIGHIDKKWIEKIENNEPVTLFCSWGRGDKQKALDVTLDAFIEHAQRPEGKNSILVIGGALGADKETQTKIETIMSRINSDKNLAGRAVFTEGFAPGMAFASASDSSISISRGAPCELIDLEAMKKFCVPIVTNSQGLKQKNYSPNIPQEADRATSYRTDSEYVMSVDELKQKSPEFKELYEKRFKAEMSKLEHRGVVEAKRNELAIENIEAAEDFLDLRNKYTDRILRDETVDRMKQFVERPKELAEKMLENMKKIETDGFKNGALHPSGKSTWQLYEEIMFNPESKPQGLNLSEPIINLRNKTVTTIQNAGEAVVQTTKNTAENAAETAKGLSKTKIGLIIGGIVAAGAGVYSYMKYQKDKAAEKDDDPSLMVK